MGEGGGDGGRGEGERRNEAGGGCDWEEEGERGLSGKLRIVRVNLGKGKVWLSKG